MQNDQISNKNERREIAYKKARMKSVLKTALFSALGVGAVGALIWYSATRPQVPEGEIVSRGGIHWHPELAIYIKVQKQFPHNYIQTALYFKATKDTDWDEVDPRMVMGKNFSAISGWYVNVDAEVKRLGLVPQQQGGAGCGV